MSALSRHLEAYLALRRRLGFKLRGTGYELHKFVRFAQEANASSITTKLALEWATQPTGCQPAQWTARLGMVRRFAEYLSAVEPRTEVPPQGLLPHRFRRKSPYLYSDREVVQLIEAAQKVPSPKGLRAATYSTLFGLLAVTGMRLGEALGLDRADVDLEQGLLQVRHTKFNKSRWVPIHSTTQAKVQEYRRLRDRILPHPQSPSFLLSEQGRRLTGARRATGSSACPIKSVCASPRIIRARAFTTCATALSFERCATGVPLHDNLGEIYSDNLGEVGWRYQDNPGGD